MWCHGTIIKEYKTVLCLKRLMTQLRIRHPQIFNRSENKNTCQTEPMIKITSHHYRGVGSTFKLGGPLTSRALTAGEKSI